MMTEQEQRIAINEWMGFEHNPTWLPEDDFPYEWAKGTPNCYQWAKTIDDLTDYPNDLNAMHEAEKKLNPDKALWPKYVANIRMLTKNGSTHSTSQQRSEALCRTLWPERFEE